MEYKKFKNLVITDFCYSVMSVSNKSSVNFDANWEKLSVIFEFSFTSETGIPLFIDDIIVN